MHSIPTLALSLLTHLPLSPPSASTSLPPPPSSSHCNTADMLAHSYNEGDAYTIRQPKTLSPYDRETKGRIFVNQVYSKLEFPQEFFDNFVIEYLLYST